MQVPGFLVTVVVIGGLLWTSYFHVLWYGRRLEVIGGYSCTDEVCATRMGLVRARSGSMSCNLMSVKR